MHKEKQSRDQAEDETKIAASILRGGSEARRGLLRSFDELHFTWDCFLEFLFLTTKHSSSLLIPWCLAVGFSALYPILGLPLPICLVSSVYSWATLLLTLLLYTFLVQLPGLPHDS